MNTFTNENLLIIEGYLLQAKKNKSDSKPEPYSFSNEEINVIFPLVVDLFKSAEDLLTDEEKNGGEGRIINFGSIANNISGSPREVWRATNFHVDLLIKVLDYYRMKQKGVRKHQLFNTALANMTGYEFQEYLREIGLLPKE